MEQKIKPGKWPYWLGGIVGVLGVGSGAVMIVLAVIAMASFSPHRMMAPGSSSATLKEAGAHSIYHEYLTELDGRRIYTPRSRRDQVWKDLRVSITDAATGEPIDVEESTMGSSYKYMNKYAGKKLFSFHVPANTEVKISASYAGGRGRPKVVLAVGKMKVLRFVVLLTAGIFAVVGGAGVALPVILLTFFLRMLSRQKLARRLQMEP